jgi:AraC-like DNA-binding protein
MDTDLALSAGGQRLAFLPPPALARVVRYFHVERASPGLVTVPATPHAMLTFFISGFSLAGGYTFARPMLCGPLSAPMQAHWQEHTTFVSALIEPQYLPLLFDVDAASLCDCPLPLADLDGAPDCAALEATLPLMHEPQQWVDALSHWLLALLDKREGARTTFIVPRSALALSTADLATQCGLSVRQLERRYLASYGLNIRDSRKMERYVRALSLLLLLPPERGMLTRVAMDAGYHDQAHMVRDFQHYIGMRPGALLQGAQEDEQLRLYSYEDPYRDIVLRGR